MGLFLFSYTDTGNHLVPSLPLPGLVVEGRYLEFRSSYLDTDFPAGYECLIASGTETQTADFVCSLPVPGTSGDSGMGLAASVPLPEAGAVAAIPDILATVITELPAPLFTARQRGGLVASIGLPEMDGHGIAGTLGWMAFQLPKVSALSQGRADVLAALSGALPVASAAFRSRSCSGSVAVELPLLSLAGTGALQGGDFVLVYEDPESAESPVEGTYGDEVLKWQN